MHVCTCLFQDEQDERTPDKDNENNNQGKKSVSAKQSEDLSESSKQVAQAYAADSYSIEQDDDSNVFGSDDDKVKSIISWYTSVPCYN